MEKVITQNNKKNICKFDDDDAEVVDKYNWHIHQGYARAYAPDGKRIFMHRLILGLRDGEYTDHINHDRLDNRRANLRKCSRAENNANCTKRTGVNFKYKGVWIETKIKKDGSKMKLIRARIGDRHLGCFKSEILAARAYDEAAKLIYGEFANLNF